MQKKKTSYAQMLENMADDRDLDPLYAPLLTDRVDDVPTESLVPRIIRVLYLVCGTTLLVCSVISLALFKLPIPMLLVGLCVSVVIGILMVILNMIALLAPTKHRRFWDGFNRRFCGAKKFFMYQAWPVNNGTTHRSKDAWRYIIALISSLTTLMPSIAIGDYPLSGRDASATNYFIAILASIGLGSLMGIILILLLLIFSTLINKLFKLHFQGGLVTFLTLSFIYGVVGLFMLTSVPDLVWIVIALCFPLTVLMALYGLGHVVPFFTEQKPKDRRFGLSLATLFVGLVGFVIVVLALSSSLGSSSWADTAEFGLHPPAGLPDPGTPGTHGYDVWFYGTEDNTFATLPSGLSKLPSSPTLDLSALVEFSDFRSLYWGYNSSAVKLRGLLWTPKNVSNAPIFVISPGNHQMTASSAKGYSYLCEHIATHGYACLSFEADYLNSILFGLQRPDEVIGRIPQGEMIARSILYLEHANLLRQWNELPDHPLYGKLDTRRLVFSGHSRSGETAASAAWLLTQPKLERFAPFPSYNLEDRRTNLNVIGVVAFAPTDGGFRPGSVSTQLHNINYMTLQGTNDFDQINSYAGLRQYESTTFDLRSNASQPIKLKLALYVYRANHAGWNTVWGRDDFGPAASWFLDRKQLIPTDDQQKIAKVMVTSFLKSIFVSNADQQYLAVLQNIRVAADWLPKTNFMNVYSDSITAYATTFNDNNGDLYQCTPHDNITCIASDVENWRQLTRDREVFRDVTNLAVYLQPNRNTSSYCLKFKGGQQKSIGTTAMSIVFDLAPTHNTRISANPSNVQLPNNEPSVIVKLGFTNGTSSTHPLTNGSRIGPSLPAEYFSIGGGSLTSNARIIMLQTYNIEESLLLSDLESVCLIFECANHCEFWLDNIGFRLA